MLCASPVSVSGVGLVGCGQCQPCRINRRRVWAHRLMLEKTQHGDSAFVTLTYKDPPLNEAGLPTLVPEHHRNFMKRLRKEFPPQSVRFYMVGEYGDETFRPHYHYVLFGVPSCSWGTTRKRDVCCPMCSLIRGAWHSGYWPEGVTPGHVYLGEVTLESMQYVAGYVLKKMTGKDDPRLEGRHPEFARMSNRHGIGYDAMFDVADAILDDELEDVPSVLLHGTRKLPLGKYLRRKLRTMIGRDEGAPESVREEVNAELHRLQVASIEAQTGPKAVYQKENLQKVRSVEARSKIFKKGSKI